MPIRKITTAIPSVIQAIRRPTVASSTESGDGASSGSSSSAIFPISVDGPVAVTIARPRPAATTVPANTIERRSPVPASSSTGRGPFVTGRLSPVRAASSVCKWIAPATRPSAATLSPASSTSTSPGTMSAAATSTSLPSRMTNAVGAAISLSLARASSARTSCVYPITAFNTTMARMTPASIHS